MFEAVSPWLRHAAAALILIWFATELIGKSKRILPATASALLFTLLAWRGALIEFFPLTNKYESFSAFTVFITGVAAYRFADLARPGRALMAFVGAVFLGATYLFESKISYAPPLMITIWYPLHVPLSFAAYAFWIASAAGSLDYILGAADEQFVRRQEANIRAGFILFSISMLFGGIWGVVSWGAYFMWDAKIIWSLVAWIYFTTFTHIKYWPRFPLGLRAAGGLIGMLIVLITYVGTSFMAGSIHGF